MESKIQYSLPKRASYRVSKSASMASALLVTTLLAAWQLWLPFLDRWRLQISGSVIEPFSWYNINPTEHLVFTPCYGKYECARLNVPLNWNLTTPNGDGKRAAIAITRLAAKVTVNDPRYGGAVLINPGGPGGSGVNFLLGRGSSLQTIVDADGHPSMSTKIIDSKEKYFDIIGFDPRGVNNTTPRVDCLPDDAVRNRWGFQELTEGFPHSNDSFATSYSRNTALAKRCSEKISLDVEGTDAVGKYVSTPNVVEDMIAIVEALGQWRENEVRRISKTLPIQSRQDALERAKWHKGNEKLNYWGFSYGTLLGATFAAMHPDRINRLVLDGVVDADDYYSGNWLKNLQDADLIVESFFKECYSAGPEKCDLYTESGPEGSKSIYDRTLQSLLEQPLPVPGEDFGPELITYSNVMSVIMRALYSPKPGFQLVARLIKELSQGNGTGFAIMKHSTQLWTCNSDRCERSPGSRACHDPTFPGPYHETTSGILCTDAPDMTKWTSKDHYARWRKLQSQSVTLAGPWSAITMACSNWRIRPEWNYDRPRTHAPNTSHPILWLSNSRDPVCPLRNALRMSTKFPGSVVFGQDADGHCTLAQPSTCVGEAVREYFQEGKLPKAGIRCKPDKGPFDLPDDKDDNRAFADLSIHEKTMSRALADLAFNMREQPYFLGI